MLDLQKASIFKRISASIFDFIVVSIIFVGCLWIFSSIFSYDTKNKELEEFRQSYIDDYDIDFYGTTEEEYNNFSEELQIAYKEFIKKFNLNFNIILLMVTFSLLIAVLIVYFVIPLFLHDGMTIGKKCFSICLMKPNHVKINQFNLFARAILGIFAIELMIPIYIIMHIVTGFASLIDLVILAALLLTQIITIIVNKNNALIHDLIAQTVVVDRSSQMIFDSEEQIIKYKEENGREAARTSTY